jgi:predicted metal-dependent HD superfamily phosphohydrolase
VGPILLGGTQVPGQGFRGGGEIWRMYPPYYWTGYAWAADLRFSSPRHSPLKTFLTRPSMWTSLVPRDRWISHGQGLITNVINALTTAYPA